MIKITSIEIDGFIVPSQKVKLDFVESNIICIYGDNGSGKTTFLEILFAVFDRDEEILERYNVSSISIEYFLDKPEIKEQIKDSKEELKYFEDRDGIQNIQRDIESLQSGLKECKEEEIDSIREQIQFLENEIETQKNRIQAEIILLEKEINTIKKIYIFKTKCKDKQGKIYDCYNFDSLNVSESEFKNVSSLFLGIGRGVHKKELNIPRQALWHFFRANKKINKDTILTGNEIDDFTDKLVKHLDNANLIEIDKAKELDDKTNIYLPHIEIDTLEAFLMSKYKDAVLDAKEKIEKALFKVSMNSFKVAFQSVNIDVEELREKLIYNKSLLLEMFAKDEDMGIETVFSGLEKNEEFLVHIDSYKQVILYAIINELQSEVELFKEIQVFLNEYNSFLNYDKNLVLSSNGVFITPENHSIQKLSSGERHLLTFLATILLMGEEQDFILIDEPEISLNVDWQRKILSTIALLAPNSQIIVATHSPLIGRSYRKSVVGLEPKVIDDEE